MSAAATAHAAHPADAAAIAAIYNEGIASRQATFETADRDAEDVAGWPAAGRALLEGLCAEAARAGFHKPYSRVLTTNAPSLAVHRAAGFREVGVQLRPEPRHRGRTVRGAAAEPTGPACTRVKNGITVMHSRHARAVPPSHGLSPSMPPFGGPPLRAASR